jgi:hypothetical protein
LGIVTVLGGINSDECGFFNARRQRGWCGPWKLSGAVAEFALLEVGVGRRKVVLVVGGGADEEEFSGCFSGFVVEMEGLSGCCVGFIVQV